MQHILSVIIHSESLSASYCHTQGHQVFRSQDYGGLYVLWRSEHISRAIAIHHKGKVKSFF